MFQSIQVFAAGCFAVLAGVLCLLSSCLGFLSNVTPCLRIQLSIGLLAAHVRTGCCGNVYKVASYHQHVVDQFTVFLPAVLQLICVPFCSGCHSRNQEACDHIETYLVPQHKEVCS